VKIQENTADGIYPKKYTAKQVQKLSNLFQEPEQHITQRKKLQNIANHRKTCPCLIKLSLLKI